VRTMIVNGEEWVQSADGQRYVRKEKTMTQTFNEYVMENVKRHFPSRLRRLEREWKEKSKPALTGDWGQAPPIDWTKPLKCNNSAVTNIKYLHTVYIFNGDESGDYHVCQMTYKQGYTYYVMYTDEGKAAGRNAGTINVKNDVQVWGKSAWMVLDRVGRVVSIKHPTRQSAELHTAAHDVGKSWLEPFQYIRYDYTEQR
jgi:hypothetical protein